MLARYASASSPETGGRGCFRGVSLNKLGAVDSYTKTSGLAVSVKKMGILTSATLRLWLATCDLFLCCVHEPAEGERAGTSVELPPPLHTHAHTHTHPAAIRGQTRGLAWVCVCVCVCVQLGISLHKHKKMKGGCAHNPPAARSQEANRWRRKTSGRQGRIQGADSHLAPQSAITKRWRRPSAARLRLRVLVSLAPEHASKHAAQCFKAAFPVTT